MRTIAVLVLFALAGCGGGAASQPHIAGVAPANSVAIAYGTLTLRFPPNTRVASGTKLRAAAANRAHPAYLNPNGSVIKIWVGGTLLANPVTIAPGPDGTQTIPNVPLYSTTTDVTAVEFDAANDVLAVGETTNVSVTAGQPATITVSMLMNATGFALSLSSDGSGAVEMTGGYDFGSIGAGTAFVYPTDPSGTFVGAAPPVGIGGLPTNTTVAIAPDTNGASIGQGSLGFAFNLGSASDGVILTASATNPAAAAVANSGSYPVLANIVGSFKNPLPITDMATPTNIVPSGYTIPAGYVWVANRSGNGGILAWPVAASGNVAPIVNLSGSRTNLTGAIPLAFDSSGDIYTGNDSASGLELFGPIASGNVPPLLSFTSSQVSTEGAAIDGQGNMYLSSYGTNPGIAEFAPGTSGHATPIAFISGPNTQLREPLGLALDSNGNIYVADAFAAAVIEFAAGSNGNVSPIAVLQGPLTGFGQPTTIAISSTNQIVVGDESAVSVSVFGAGSNGNTAPTTVLSGPATGFQAVSGVALDTTNRVWESDALGFIERFAPGANGNVAPAQVIQGAATLLNDPQNVHVP